MLAHLSFYCVVCVVWPIQVSYILLPDMGGATTLRQASKRVFQAVILFTMKETNKYNVADGS